MIIRDILILLFILGWQDEASIGSCRFLPVGAGKASDLELTKDWIPLYRLDHVYQGIGTYFQLE